MTTWAEFKDAAPALAALGEELFERTGLSLVGSVRRDGSPRISPCEPYWFDGDLYLGMMWQSRKALDLVRDPRCVVHSTVSDKAGTDGEFKAYGLARDVPEPARREKYCVTLDEQIGWRPSEPFHLFALDLTAVGYCRFADGTQVVRRWRRGGPELPIEKKTTP
jgi:hypothetical protein